MKKPLNSRFEGFISIIPLAVITLLVIASFTFLNQNKTASLSSKTVLSESDDEEVESESSLRNEEEEEDEQEENETPEPEETSEPEETDEPEEEDEEIEDDQEDENEVEVEVENEEGSNQSKVKIRQGKNKFEFQQEGTKFQVESDFPISVNPDTRELTVETPEGIKTVAILPQEAINKILATRIISNTFKVKLKNESDGLLSYEIEGSKNEKLLGVFDVDIPKNLIVSAQSGQVLTVNQTTFSKILDFLSI